MTRGGQCTAGQLRLLAFIVRHIETHGVAPTTPEMARGVADRRSTVYRRQMELESAGYVRRTGRHPRAIVVLRRVEGERAKSERGK